MEDDLKRVLLVGAAVVTLALGGAAIAGAQAGDDGSRAIAERTDDDRDAPYEREDDDAAQERVSGAAADAARAAALREVGGGTVTEVEVADDGESGYEVEIDKADGTSVEVNVTAAGSVGAVQVDD